MRNKKRFYRGMTRDKADEMRFMYFKGKKKQIEIAEIFGVRQGNVSRIISNRVWI